MAKKRSTLQWIELGAVLAVILIAALLVLPYIKYNFFQALPTTCVGNLQQWATVLSMYRTENGYSMPLVQGYQPFGPAENAEGCLNVHDEFAFIPELTSIFPEYSNNPLILVCPDGPFLSPPEKLGPVVTKPWRPNEEAFGVLENEGLFSCGYAGSITNGDASYTYLGWRIDKDTSRDYYITQEQAAQLRFPSSGPASVVAILQYFTVPEGSTFQDMQHRRNDNFDLRDSLTGLNPDLIKSSGSGQSVTLFRQYMGFLFGEQMDAEGKPTPVETIKEPPPDRPYFATTPVLWDTIYQDASGEPRFTHAAPNGLNVLYMDGHVEFVQYPGTFPATKAFATMRAVVP